ncbi:MoxR-like ATPase [Fervidobacterium changbaicum]|uniref:MoxR family ATPase n=1 Tax=Fervidobacterium changbaicum TaxID=310769 RepID=A0ABX5QR24_9BACT|nr:MoxR family ATPase [Fervidobacterium changbaicum]QAV32763.1 MoxR family ATPase [Fervidobacterium changbaicum]SDG96392.1 MoxR-like ATPase [Fervidobacterium changbaicum]
MEKTQKKLHERVIENVEKVIKGKSEQIKIVLAAMYAGGHVLLEDVPGVGKTILARSLAISLGLNFKRVQFTPDLLPTDLTGLSIYDRKTETFVFREGPVFTDILLADEINRATPRTQSALLEAMAERQVTVDGVTHKLSNNFFVIATQNPIEYEGTFPLPEAQLDRFTIRISLGYPDKESEMEILESQKVRHPIDELKAVGTSEEFSNEKLRVREVKISQEVKEYIVNIVDATRRHESLKYGSSPRGSLALMHVSMAWAYINGRDFVLPDDVKKVAPYVLIHRIIQNTESKILRESKEDILNDILEKVPVVVEK